jgi:hypothetical protein
MMRKIAADSRALRQLAEELLEEIAEDEGIPEAEREDLATSLVRQWVSYDGNATLFLGGRQVYLVLGQTPLGRPCVVPLAAPEGWLKELSREWKVLLYDLPEALDHLNRGQSAEVVNADGVPLRLWVNPREKSRGVEPLGQANVRPGAKRDFLQMAAAELVEQFGVSLDPEEMDGLARSVARQWQRHSGHACLFVGGHQQLVLKLVEQADGTCEVVSRRAAVDLEGALSTFGFSAEVMPQVIAGINLDQGIDFRDRQGVRCRLSFDPEAGRIDVRPVDLVPPPAPPQTPPVVCPKCTAVLRPWQGGERQQTCAHCGHAVSLPGQPALAPRTPPVCCPHCTAVLRPWCEGQRQQTCPNCGCNISLG